MLFCEYSASYDVETAFRDNEIVPDILGVAPTQMLEVSSYGAFKSGKFEWIECWFCRFPIQVAFLLAWAICWHQPKLKISPKWRGKQRRVPITPWLWWMQIRHHVKLRNPFSDALQKSSKDNIARFAIGRSWTFPELLFKTEKKWLNIWVQFHYRILAFIAMFCWCTNRNMEKFRTGNHTSITGKANSFDSIYVSKYSKKFSSKCLLYNYVHFLRTISNRPLTSVTRFARKYNLGEPVFGNFFQAQYDEYSDKLLGDILG